MKKQWFSSLLSLAICMVTAQTSLALGFRNPDQGGAATGRGEAFVASANDPSAVWYNPAGMTQLKGTHLYAGAYFVSVRSEAQLLSGGFVKTKGHLAALPQLYVVSDLGLEKWRFGFGLNSPFGMKIDWGNDVPFRTVITKAEMRLINLNPSVAFQITPQLSIGVGLNYYLSDAELTAGFLPPGAPLFGTDSIKFEGDGGGLGYNFGLLWRPHERHSFGVAYRSKVQINYRGTETVTNGPLPPLFPPTLVNASAPAQTSVIFPQMLTIGYAFQATPKLSVEVNADWTGWEQLNALNLDTTLVPFTVPLHWKSSWFFEFGADYKLNDAWTLRAGYAFSENSVPAATFNPMLPDSDRHIISVGAGYHRGPWTFNMLYQYTFGPDRTINGNSVNSPAVDGTYSTDAHAIAISISRKF